VEFWDKEELIHAAKITVNSWVKVIESITQIGLPEFIKMMS
jgi:hypothetical protein